MSNNAGVLLRKTSNEGENILVNSTQLLSRKKIKNDLHILHLRSNSSKCTCMIIYHKRKVL